MSRRMAGVDKLMAPILGRPLLAWTLDAIASAPVVGRIVLVAGGDRAGELSAAPWLPERVVAVVAGGARRQDSVAAGLAALDRLDEAAGTPAASTGRRIVLVHDGARPLVSGALIAAVADATDRLGVAIPAVPVAETLKRVEGGRVGGTVDRSDLVAAQTPQGVRRALLRQAFRRFPPGNSPEFTDEASLLEACRIAVHLVPGEASNLKVTVPADLLRVEQAIAGFRPTRVGFGTDAHPFGPGLGLRLGGITIDGAPRLHGHSDGDVVLHAVADALLGAAGLGDLGRLFPADARTPRGVDSRRLLAEVVERLGAAGWRPARVDITVEAARPRLGPRLDAMAEAIAADLGIDRADVSVKASSGNLDGATGAGRVVAARALATIDRLDDRGGFTGPLPAAGSSTGNERAEA
jgi:2-C-methyl-D-erythritol 4-phosphate cytidylyltransferase/2-C-methyl-D-erythritol 2,4-cyclodiphosphate synthase